MALRDEAPPLGSDRGQWPSLVTVKASRLRPCGSDSASHSDCVGMCLIFEDGCLFTWRHGWGEESQRLEIEHWRQLLLQLVEDRCEGRDAWERVLRLLERAGIGTSSAWRGYG